MSFSELVLAETMVSRQSLDITFLMISYETIVSKATNELRLLFFFQHFRSFYGNEINMSAGI